MPEFDFEAARDYLKSAIAHFGRVNGKFKIIQYMQTALFAVEKQIKKKPKDIEPDYEDYGRCPCCDANVDKYDDGYICESCGQALDWSETE